jgi:hypothetical protein
LLCWPLVGIKLAGAERSQQHWVLLESDAYLGGEPTDTVTRTGVTHRENLPPPLAPAELTALTTTFAEYLRWPPPTTPPQPRQLRHVATRLGKSLSGVQDRLRSAQGKALRLGLPSPATLTHPEYFYVLVAAGYVLPSARRPYRRRIEGSATDSRATAHHATGH